MAQEPCDAAEISENVRISRRITEFDRISMLPLPDHMNHLMELFEQFETQLSSYRSRHESWTISLERIQLIIQ